MTTLYLVRHGEVDANKTFYGHLDLPLSERGQAQIQRVAEALEEVDLQAVHSSDLRRALQSAEPIARLHGLEPVGDPAFREMSLGVLEGLPYAEARVRYPELADKRYDDMWSHRFPGGENLQDIADRARPALRRLLDAHPDPEAAILLVAHNSVNRVILGDALGLSLDKVFDFAQDFGCVNRVDYGRRVRVRLVNWTVRALGSAH